MAELFQTQHEKERVIVVAVDLGDGTDVQASLDE